MQNGLDASPEWGYNAWSLGVEEINVSQNQDATSCCVWKNKALSGVSMVPQVPSSLGPIT